VTTITNLNNHAISVKIVAVSEEGAVTATDHITIMPKRKVTLPAGYSVNTNWASKNPKVVVNTKED
jgi:hypothetical protein